MFDEPIAKTDNEIKGNQFWTEMFGTFALTYFCALSVMAIDIHQNTAVGNAIAQFLVLAFVIYAGARVSGANYNAAVTLALMTTRHIGVKKGFWYLLAQFCGALLSCLILMLYKSQYHGDFGNRKMPNTLGFPHCDTKNFNVGVCFLMEFISTCMLVFVVYLTAVSKNKEPATYAFCIAATLGVSCFANGAITGAGLNLWRMFPASLLTGELFKNSYNYSWVYFLANTIAGPICGAVWIWVYQEKKPVEAKPEQGDETEPIVNAGDVPA